MVTDFVQLANTIIGNTTWTNYKETPKFTPLNEKFKGYAKNKGITGKIEDGTTRLAFDNSPIYSYHYGLLIFYHTDRTSLFNMCKDFEDGLNNCGYPVMINSNPIPDNKRGKHEKHYRIRILEAK